MLSSETPLLQLIFNTVYWRVRRSLIAKPEPHSFAFCAQVVLMYIALAITIGFRGEFFQPEVADWGVLQGVGLFILIMIVPALLEEVVFRAVLIPHPQEGVELFEVCCWSGLSLFLFVGMHPLQTWLFPHLAETFQHPVFLLLVGLLGLVNTLLYIRSGSIWPGVILHGLSVFIWKWLLGGSGVLG